jgi:hypothetical protein
MGSTPRREFEQEIDGVRRMHADLVRGIGGTPGGTWLFFTNLGTMPTGLPNSVPTPHQTGDAAPTAP